MEGFFRLCSQFDSERQVIELLLRRYSNIDYILNMDFVDFCEFVEYAQDKEKEEGYKAEWNALYPFMIIKVMKYVSFKEYVDICTGANIDTRPAGEIIAEIEELHKNAKGG